MSDELDLKADKETELINEQKYESQMRTDFEFCMFQLNAAEVANAIRELEHSLTTQYSWNLTRKELCEHLEEYM